MVFVFTNKWTINALIVVPPAVHAAPRPDDLKNSRNVYPAGQVSD
jgi:hypothetical protein